LADFVNLEYDRNMQIIEKAIDKAEESKTNKSSKGRGKKSAFA